MRDTVPYDWLASRAYLSADDTAVIDLMTRTKISYRTLNQRANQLANYLIEEEGVAVGDRVAILALNVNQVIELYFACQKIGAIFVPLNWRLKQSELAYVMEDCEAKVLFYSEDLTQKLQGDWQHVVPTVIEITSEAYQNIFEYPELPETFSPAISGDQVAIMIYTSGTTGMPKGVMLSYAGIQQNALNTIVTWDMGRKDSALATAPLFHVAALFGNVIPLLLAGGTVVLMPYFMPDKITESLIRCHITMCFMVPTMYYEWLDTDTFDPKALDTVRILIAGGGPPLASVTQRFAELGHPLINSYGLSEAGPNNFRITPADVREHPNSIGRPAPFVDIRLEDDNGNLVAPGKVGELVIGGNHCFVGYWNNEEATEKTLINGYVHTGDLAKQTEDGLYYIIGRKKELIITGGENVTPYEVEKVLLAMDWIDDAVVVGYDNPKYGESVGALIKVNRAIDDPLAEIKAYTKTRLAGYKRPKQVVIWDNEFPQTSLGKVDRKKISQILRKNVKKVSRKG